MENVVEGYFEKALRFEELGHIEAALQLLDKLLETFLANKEELLFEKAKMEFRNGYVKEALFNFISVFEMSENNEVYELILEAYYQPNKKRLMETFHKNISCLETYPHYRNEFECRCNELDLVPVWQDEEVLLCTNIKEKSFVLYKRNGNKIDTQTNQVVMAINKLWLEDIFCLEEKFRIEVRFMDMDLPLYLVYDIEFWLLYLQLYNLQEIIKKNRIVFLVGVNCFYEYMKEGMVILPTQYYFDVFQEDYVQVLIQVKKELSEEYQNNLGKVNAYYRENAGVICQRIKEGHPKFLFYTSRFTTVLQYHTRDCMEAVRRLGCEAELMIEPDGIHRTDNYIQMRLMAQFKPDIIFCIDHFRFEYMDLPEEVVWITWIQDHLPNILDKNTPLKLIERDFVMNHLTTWRGIKRIGYDETKLIQAPVPANSHIYKPYTLSEEEIEKYTCDICFVCHASDVDEHIRKLIINLPEEIQEAVCAIYKGYHEYVYETGEVFYSAEVFSEFIDGAARHYYNMIFNADFIRFLAKDMFEDFNQRVFRQVLVDWILEAGFNNIKLWGNGWAIEERYRKYAMGSAKNGETLSKIYQASKIVIGNNVMTTSAARAWETMLSGGFYMSNYIPEEEDITDIRKIIEVGKDVVMFYNKDDLIEKLHYYLRHEEERKEMIERGRKAAVEHMTFDILMKRVLEEVAERLEEEKNG